MEILQLIGAGHWREWPQSAYALINMQIKLPLIATNEHERAELSGVNLAA